MIFQLLFTIISYIFALEKVIKIVTILPIFIEILGVYSQISWIYV